MAKSWAGGVSEFIKTTLYMSYFPNFASDHTIEFSEDNSTSLYEDLRIALTRL